MTTARDKYFYTRTLCCLLKSLEGVETEIELRNESHVKGTVESVSAAMNVTMCNCELIREGCSKQLQRLLVQGRKIRMVAIPDHIDMVDAMQSVINMFNVKTLGRNEFRKTPKQKGRGTFLGNGRGRGRGMNVRGRGRGDIGAHRGGRGRGRSQGIVDRNLVQRSQYFTGSVPADSRKRSESAHFASSSHSVDSSDGEVSMLCPEYMKQAFRDPIATSVTKDGNSRLNTQTVHALVHSQRETETSQNIDTTEQQDHGTRQTKSQVHDSRLRVSEVQCSAISSKARSAVASGDLRYKLLKHRSPQGHRDKPDVRHRDKSSRSTEDSRPHQSSSRKDEHYVERSSTYTGRLPEKQYHQTEKRKEKPSHHLTYDDGNQSRSHHSEYSYEGQPTSREPSYRRHQPVRDSRSTQGKERDSVCVGDTRKTYAGGTELSSSAAKPTRDRRDVRDYSLSEVPSGESPLSRDRQSFRDRAQFREEDRSSADRVGNYTFDSEDSPHRRDRPHSKGNRPHAGEKGRSVTDRNRSFYEDTAYSKRDLHSKERSYSREEDRSGGGRESRPSSKH